MDAVAEQLREEARRLEAHGAAWGGSVERECQEEAGILRACADELSDEQRRRTHGGQPSQVGRLARVHPPQRAAA